MFSKPILRSPELLLKGLATLIFSIAISAAAAPVKAQPSESIAQIKRIVVNDVLVDSPTSAQVKVTRAQNRISEAGHRGGFLFDKDEITTGRDVKLIVIIRHPDVENYRRIIIGSNTRARIRRGSLFLYLGKVSVRIRGLFDVKTNYVSMGARGTEFECEVREGDAVQLTTLDGQVTVQKGDFRSLVASADARSTPAVAVAASESPISSRGPGDAQMVNALVAPHLFRATAAREASRQQTPQAVPPAEAGRQQIPQAVAPEVVIRSRQTIAVARDVPFFIPGRELTANEVRTVLDWADRTIIADAPDVPAPQIIPQFESAAERVDAYKEARFQAVMQRRGNSHEVLGQVLIDWGEGTAALDEYQHQLDSPQARSRASKAKFFTDRSEAYRLIAEGRLTAQLNKAEQRIRQAIALNPQYAPAYNSRGNIAMDKANAIRRTNPVNAQALLETALIDYRYALETSSPKHKAVAKANQGFAHLRLGDIARDAGDLDAARTRYERAREAFEEAKALDPAYPYAEEGKKEASTKIAPSQSRTEPPPTQTPLPPITPAFLCTYTRRSDSTPNDACKAFLTVAATWLAADPSRLLLVRSYNLGEADYALAQARASEISRYVKPRDPQQIRFNAGEITLPEGTSQSDRVGNFAELRLVPNCQAAEINKANECASFVNLYNKSTLNRLAGWVAQINGPNRTLRAQDLMDLLGHENFSAPELLEVDSNWEAPQGHMRGSLPASSLLVCTYKGLSSEPEAPCQKLLDRLVALMSDNPNTVLLMEDFITDAEQRDIDSSRMKGEKLSDLHRLRVNYISRYLREWRIAPDRIKGVTSPSLKILSLGVGKALFYLIPK